MKNCLLLLFFFIPSMLFAQSKQASKHRSLEKQFVLFDAEFTYTKEDADNSTPSKSHFYVKGNMFEYRTPDRLW
jgi:hypothetical protein